MTREQRICLIAWSLDSKPCSTSHRALFLAQLIIDLAIRSKRPASAREGTGAGGRMKKKPDIIEAIKHPKLFGALPEFKDLSTWFAWIVWLKSLYGLPMDERELSLFQKCTARTRPPVKEPKESATIVGRRGGKSKMAALVGAFTARSSTSSPTCPRASGRWF